MDARELLQGQLLGALMQSTFTGRTRSETAVESLTPAADEWQFDEQALLRWADDGGRGVAVSVGDVAARSESARPSRGNIAALDC